MKSFWGPRLAAAIAVVCLLAFPGALCAQYTTVTTTTLGGSQTPANGTIYWQAILAARIGSNGGQILSGMPAQAAVTSGASSVTIPDAQLSAPNICYAVTVVDGATGATLLGAGLDSYGHVRTGGPYGCVQPTGSSWSFDAYQPNSTAVTPPPTGGTVTGPTTFNAPVTFGSTMSGTSASFSAAIAAAAAQFTGTAWSQGLWQWASPTGSLQAPTKAYADGRSAPSVYNLTCFGDSITAGQGVATPGPGAGAEAWCYKLQNDLGLPSAQFSNSGVSGNLVTNMAPLIYQQNGGLPLGANYNYASTIQIGTNDANVEGTSTGAETLFTQVLRASVIWRAIPDFGISQASPAAGLVSSQWGSFCTASGTWTQNSPFGGSFGMSSSTVGDYIQCTISTPGTAVYILGLYRDADPDSQATVLIDGASPGNDATLAQPITPLNNDTVNLTVPFATRYVVTAGTHTIRVTVSAAPNGHSFAFYGVGAPAYTSYAGPRVLNGGVLLEQDSSTDTATAAYDGLVQTVDSQLASDGLNVTFVDVRDAVSRADLSGSPNTRSNGEVCAASTNPGLHPNVCGHQDIEDAYLESFGNRAPFEWTWNVPVPANLAYTNQINTFSQSQVMYNNAFWYWNDSGGTSRRLFGLSGSTVFEGDIDNHGFAVNHVAGSSQCHNFYVGGSNIGTICSDGLRMGSGGPIANTNLVPQASSTQTAGSLVCIKSAGPPPIYGTCTAVSGATCTTCN